MPGIETFFKETYRLRCITDLFEVIHWHATTLDVRGKAPLIRHAHAPVTRSIMMTIGMCIVLLDVVELWLFHLDIAAQAYMDGSTVAKAPLVAWSIVDQSVAVTS